MARGEERIILYLQGMTCMFCAKRVEESLRGVPGVSGVRVDFEAAGQRSFMIPKRPPRKSFAPPWKRRATGPVSGRRPERGEP